MVYIVCMNTYSQWDLAGLLDKFGTLREIQRGIFNQTGQTVSIKTIHGWRSRNSIPVTFALVLVNLAIKRGLIKNIDALDRAHNEYRKALRRRASEKRVLWSDL